MMEFCMTDRRQKCKLELVSVHVLHPIDENPDLSWLGEYSDSPADVHIDRQAEGDMNRNEYRYFNMSDNYKDESHTNQQKYMRQDYRRMESYNHQDWYCMGIKATAMVSRKIDPQHCQLHSFESSGIWGTESDSDNSHISEMENEQLCELRDVLDDFGVDCTNFWSLVTR